MRSEHLADGRGGGRIALHSEELVLGTTAAVTVADGRASKVTRNHGSSGDAGTIFLFSKKHFAEGFFHGSVRRLFSMAVVTLVAPLYIIANFSFMAFFVFIGDFPTRVGIVSTGFLTLIAFMFVVDYFISKSQLSLLKT